MKGNITRRGKTSWRLKYDAGRNPVTGERDTRFQTVRGTKKEAQAELTRILAALDAGNFVRPSALTIADYLKGWIDAAEALKLSAKTAERYRQLIDRQIIPHLGAVALQKLKVAQITEWHGKLIAGTDDFKPIVARTAGHAHRVLRKALQDALTGELITRNPAALVPAPKVNATEMEILDADQVTAVLERAVGTSYFPHVVVLLGTGMRRGELFGLQWADIDLDKAALRVERAIEKTKAHGLRVKSPKTKYGRRPISLPGAAVEALREHRKRQLEIRLALGLGKLPAKAFVFGDHEGNLRDPDWLSQAWERFVESKKLPKVTLHALRHTHASALIAAGTDLVTISRRLGHSSPTVTLSVYAHLFRQTDGAVVTAADSMFRGSKG